MARAQRVATGFRVHLLEYKALVVGDLKSLQEAQLLVAKRLPGVVFGLGLDVADDVRDL